jgi:SpoVK/Ycf46/Vps4 family AAA+-type ATPase
LLTRSRLRKPDFGAGFPAQRVTTALDWEDRVLAPRTLEMLGEIRTWLDHGPALLKDPEFAARIAPGFRSLFSGPPGTGKTLSAGVLGKVTGRDVYRIDLSQVVSKYVGETEKNLERVFRKAQHRDWILFFDEADALFGKRSEVGHAHDRWANQEVSYLLQRVEDFPGVVLLATKLQASLDSGFVRRFQSIIKFAMPNRTQRRRLWQDGFSSRLKLEDEAGLQALSDQSELSGASIMNVARLGSTKPPS